MISHKNTLQEFCQRNKHPMPIYETYSEGPPHLPQWFSKISVILENKVYSAESQEPQNRSQMAEQHVAQLLYEQLVNVRTSPKKSTDVSSMRSIKFDLSSLSKIYIIDLENKPCFNKTLNSSDLYIGFISSTHHAIPKYTSNGWNIADTDDVKQLIESNGNNKLLYLVEGGLIDLADHMMTMFIYPLTEFIIKINFPISIVIVTGDNAGWCTTACLRTMIKWKNTKLIEQIINSISIE
jgi:hypothetical protein